MSRGERHDTTCQGHACNEMAPLLQASAHLLRAYTPPAAPRLSPTKVLVGIAELLGVPLPLRIHLARRGRLLHGPPEPAHDQAGLVLAAQRPLHLLHEVRVALCGPEVPGCAPCPPRTSQPSVPGRISPRGVMARKAYPMRFRSRPGVMRWTGMNRGTLTAPSAWFRLNSFSGRMSMRVALPFCSGAARARMTPRVPANTSSL